MESIGKIDGRLLGYADAEKFTATFIGMKLHQKEMKGRTTSTLVGSNTKATKIFL